MAIISIPLMPQEIGLGRTLDLLTYIWWPVSGDIFSGKKEVSQSNSPLEFGIGNLGGRDVTQTAEKMLWKWQGPISEECIKDVQ
jgi:hypothetical protein